MFAQLAQATSKPFNQKDSTLSLVVPLALMAIWLIRCVVGCAVVAKISSFWVFAEGLSLPIAA